MCRGHDFMALQWVISPAWRVGMVEAEGLRFEVSY